MEVEYSVNCWAICSSIESCADDDRTEVEPHADGLCPHEIWPAGMSRGTAGKGSGGCCVNPAERSWSREAPGTDMAM